MENKDCKIIVEYPDPDSAEEDSKLEDKSFNDNEIGVSNNSLNPVPATLLVTKI